MHDIIKHFINKVTAQTTGDIALMEKIKREYSKNYKTPFFKNPEIKKVYEKMVLSGEIKPNPEFERLLITKKIRTLSGVAVVAVLTKAYPCPGKCIYCPDEATMPKSYLSNEPAVMRAITTGFDPYRQVQTRLRALQLNGHSTDKIELIVMGGTFSYLPLKYQKKFIYQCFKACNDYPQSFHKRRSSQATQKVQPTDIDKLIEKEQKRNEKASNRIVGLTLETRPDYISAKELIRFRKLGATRVELGVQSLDDDILKKNKRGHLVEETIRATKMLKEAGFKINYHMMPGLLGSSAKKDVAMFRQLFTDERFQPDMIKIYPCVVTNNSELYSLWKSGQYKALTNRTTQKIIENIKKEIPPYVRITRLVRDIPLESIIAGPNISNLRQVIQQSGIICQCIRCREVRSDFASDNEIIMERIDYEASGGKEIFLQYVSTDKKKLYALLRLRIQTVDSPLLPALKNAALIREIHTYGKMVKIKDKDKKASQHIGLGKSLVTEAERIARKEYNRKKIAIISGVGVRGYYRKLGYRLKDTYMIKSIIK